MKSNMKTYYLYTFAVAGPSGCLTWKASAFSDIKDNYDYFKMYTVGAFVNKFSETENVELAKKKILAAREIIRQNNEQTQLLLDYGILCDKLEKAKQLILEIEKPVKR